MRLAVGEHQPLPLLEFGRPPRNPPSALLAVQRLTVAVMARNRTSHAQMIAFATDEEQWCNS